MLKYLSSLKIDVSKLTRGYQAIQSKYLGQKGKVPVLNADFNTIFNTYTSFIEGLTADQKILVKNYIGSKEKTN